jgi:hypothetical protein
MHSEKDFNDAKATPEIFSRQQHATDITHLQSLIHDLSEQVKQLKQVNTVAPHTVSPVINNTSTINNNINITVNQFGKEDLSHLSHLDLDRMLYRTRLGLVQLMEYIHFRHDSGKNKNVRVSTMKEEMLEYFNGRRWLYGWKGDILNSMMEKGIDVMSDHFDNEQDKLRKNWSLTMYDHVENWLNKMQDRNDDVLDPAMRELFLMLCNNTTSVASCASCVDRTPHGVNSRRKSV